MPEHHAQFEVGGVLIWSAYPENVHRWRILGIHLGAPKVQSLFEVESLTHEPGRTGEWEIHQRMFIPEVLTRTLEYEPPEAGWKELA